VDLVLEGEEVTIDRSLVELLADLPAGCPFAGRCAWAIDACRAAVPAEFAVGSAHGARCVRIGASP
jgi:ABC-type dipeptide/oligopeptide/nickel transport system ATPase component